MRVCPTCQLPHHDKGTHLEQLFAFVSVDAQGSEGIIAAQGTTGPMPLVATDEAKVEQLRPIAMSVAKRSGITVKLVRFRGREELETYSP